MGEKLDTDDYEDTLYQLFFKASNHLKKTNTVGLYRMLKNATKKYPKIKQAFYTKIKDLPHSPELKKSLEEIFESKRLVDLVKTGDFSQLTEQNLNLSTGESNLLARLTNIGYLPNIDKKLLSSKNIITKEIGFYGAVNLAIEMHQIKEIPENLLTKHLYKSNLDILTTAIKSKQIENLPNVGIRQLKDSIYNFLQESVPDFPYLQKLVGNDTLIELLSADPYRHYQGAIEYGITYFRFLNDSKFQNIPPELVTSKILDLKKDKISLLEHILSNPKYHEILKNPKIFQQLNYVQLAQASDQLIHLATKRILNKEEYIKNILTDQTPQVQKLRTAVTNILATKQKVDASLQTLDTNPSI